MRHESSQHEFVANCFAMNLPRLNSTDMASSHFAIGVSHIYLKQELFFLSGWIDRITSNQVYIRSWPHKNGNSYAWKPKNCPQLDFPDSSATKIPSSELYSWSGPDSHLEDKVLGIFKNPMYIWLDFMNFAAHAGNDSAFHHHLTGLLFFAYSKWVDAIYAYQSRWWQQYLYNL